MRITLALLMMFGVLISAINAVLRYIFSIGAPWSQELPQIFCGLATLMAIAYAYLPRINAHIRVDIIKSNTQQRKNLIESVGIMTCLVPWMVLILWNSFETPASFIRLSVRTLETSDQIGGLPMIFLYKSSLGIFAIAMLWCGFLWLQKICKGVK